MNRIWFYGWVPCHPVASVVFYALCVLAGLCVLGLVTSGAWAHLVDVPHYKVIARLVVGALGFHLFAWMIGMEARARARMPV